MIKEITREEANQLFVAWSRDGSSSKKGLFYCKNGAVYVGIDNTSQDYWCEDFGTLEECIAWLNGKERE